MSSICGHANIVVFAFQNQRNPFFFRVEWEKEKKGNELP